MAKSKKKENPESLKNRTTIYLSKELQAFAKENGLNVSKLANNALNRLRMGLGERFRTNTANLVLISGSEPKIEASGEIRTRGLVLTKDALYH